MKPMTYYIIAGEASGDLHGGNLIKELLKLDPQGKVVCWGGENMEQAGGKVVKNYRSLAFMGFWEVIKNLPVILKNISFCKKDILSVKPDVVILIDYPGFNLRIAKWAKKQGFKTIYYISPQIWAWKEGRVKGIKRFIDKMIVILPFEKAFYKKWNYEVDYVGHPLVQTVENFRKVNHQIKTADFSGTEKPIIALLPGSRKQEILAKLPLMLKAVKHFLDYQFIVAKAPGAENSFYEDELKNYPEVVSVNNKSYELLSLATAALVTSGTATLETALFHVPQVICYKGNPISYAIAKKLVNIKFIGLANLIMNKEVVKELIQDELNEKNIVSELAAVLPNGNKRAQVLKDYNHLQDILSEEVPASAKAAGIIHKFLLPTQ